LDEGFIKRYLGELTSIEETRLLQLRRKFQGTHAGKVRGVAFTAFHMGCS